jgi:hypothetical protein
VMAKALVCRDMTLHWSSRHAAHQLWARLTSFPPPLPRTLAAHHRSTMARHQSLGARQGLSYRFRQATCGVQVAGGAVIIGLLNVGVRLPTALRVPSCRAARVERSRVQREDQRAMGADSGDGLPATALRHGC